MELNPHGILILISAFNSAWQFFFWGEVRIVTAISLYPPPYDNLAVYFSMSWIISRSTAPISYVAERSTRGRRTYRVWLVCARTCARARAWAGAGAAFTRFCCLDIKLHIEGFKWYLGQLARLPYLNYEMSATPNGQTRIYLCCPRKTIFLFLEDKSTAAVIDR